MLVSKRVSIKISQNNVKYWRDLGYSFVDPQPQLGIKGAVIEVSTDQLEPKSNVKVECWCENCESFFTKRFSQYSQFCNKCNKVEQNKGHIGNTYGSANKGKKLLSMLGDLHPRWNPNKTEFRVYASQVSRLTRETYRANENVINPSNYPRTLCGVEGGYQLDHIISIKRGFDNKIPAEVLSRVDNLQMLPWKANRTKWHNVV